MSSRGDSLQVWRRAWLEREIDQDSKIRRAAGYGSRLVNTLPRRSGVFLSQGRDLGWESPTLCPSCPLQSRLSTGEGDVFPLAKFHSTKVQFRTVRAVVCLEPQPVSRYFKKPWLRSNLHLRVVGSVRISIPVALDGVVPDPVYIETIAAVEQRAKHFRGK